MMALKKTLPILFVHSGKQWYLKKTIRMAEAYNDEVFLLGDRSNQMFCRNWIAQDSLNQKRFLEFKKIYRHMSSNLYEFELNCFKRFYLIYEFMIQQDISECIMLDSDLCSFVCYLKLDFVKAGFDAAYSIPEKQEPFVWAGSPHMSYWNAEGLKQFLEFIEDSYKNNIELLERKYQYHKESGKDGGICDMTLLYLWMKNGTARIYNTAVETKEGVFDHSLSVSSNYKSEEYQFDMNYKIKHIEWEKKTPYFIDAETGERVKALTLLRRVPVNPIFGPFQKSRAGDGFVFHVKCTFKLGRG